MSDEPRQQIYEGDGVTVRFEPRLCLHWGRCWTRLPEVFRPRERPWIHPDQAPADVIAEAVMRCPSGALTFQRTDGGANEEPEETIQVRVVPNGPLLVTGDLDFRRKDGTALRRMTRAALCRCGHSRNKPFCDNSHEQAGFRAD